MKKKIVVVGAGIGGLATAALLAKDGHQVTVLEKNSLVGGRARYLYLNGFIFDMGPSWYMMPEVFENFFNLFGKKVSDFFQLKKLPIHYRVFFEDGQLIDISSDLKKNLETFKKFEENGDIKLKKILAKAKYVYDTSMKELVFKDYQSLTQLLRPVVIKNLLRFNLFQSLDDYLKKIINNEKLRKVLEFTTVFLGGSPFNTPAFYQLVAHADFNLGIYYPIGGIYRIIDALVKLCQTYKVEIKTNEEVIKIESDNQKIKKVLTKNNTYPSDVVVVNADMAFFETKILPKKFQTYSLSYWKKRTLSPSAFLIYAGINDPIKKSDHHNLYFTNQWEKHFETVYQNPQIPDNPSFYWHIPSKTDPNLAPKNYHSVMILVPLSAKIKFNKDSEKAFYEKIINQFAQINEIKNIKEKIVVKKIFHQQNFINDYHSYEGTAFGIAHTLFQTAIFRPKNFSKKLKNLFYVGHHTNPGIGMPPVLISSQIVYNLIKKNEKNLEN